MTDAEYEAQRERILSLSKWWIDALGLWQWEINFSWARDSYKTPGAPDGRESVASTDVDWDYAQATITWNMPEVTRFSERKLEEICCHELMHVVVNSMRCEHREDAPDLYRHEELVCTMLARAYLRLRYPEQETDETSAVAAPDAASEEVKHG